MTTFASFAAKPAATANPGGQSTQPPWPGFTRGMGIGGWLTNYKRFSSLPQKWRLETTRGDLEHFDSYITERDVENIKSMGFDHVRLGFDQIVLEEEPGKWRDGNRFSLVDDDTRQILSPELLRACLGE